MTTDSAVAERLAREGRVRGVAPEATVQEIAARMTGAQAAALLHDGAGWDVSRIAAELSLGEAEVRRRVGQGRLRATDLPCDPCPSRLDGLVAFAADAIDHSMDCAGCKAAREALRDGKGRIRTAWNAGDVDPVRPWHAAADQRKAPTTDAAQTSRPAAVVAAQPNDDGNRLRRRQTRSGPKPSRSNQALAEADAETAEEWAERVRRERTATVTDGPTSAPGAGDPPPRMTADGTPIRPIVIPNRSPKPAEDPAPPKRRRRRRFGLGLSLLSSGLLTTVLLGSLAASGGRADPVVPKNPATTANESRQRRVAVSVAAGATAAVITGPRIPSATWDRLAGCESSGDWSANTGNGFYGGLQFTQDSWEFVGGTGRADEAPRSEQIARATVLQRAQGWMAWPACSQRLGLR